MEVVPPRLRKIWKDWELRGLVLFSLLLQLLLVLLGNRRRYIPSLWIRVTVWCAYLLADTVATLGLGNISGDLGNIYDEGGVVDFSHELSAFWAPFLLLHLGGPDTITAYSLEDTTLWLRHLFELLNQTIVTVYIFLMAWSRSRLSVLTIPMFFAGLIKYGERTWNLWKASADELREDPNYVDTKKEESSRRPRDEGLSLCWKIAEFVAEVREHDERRRIPEGYPPEIQQMMDAIAEEEFYSDDKKIIEAHYFLKKSKALFADLLVSTQDALHIQSLLVKMSHEEAFDVVATELGFMYDLLYTKAKVIYTPWGLAYRFITLSLTSSVLAIFSLGDNNKYNKGDVSITFLLLAVAIFLEVYAAVVLLFSDRTKLWLIKHKKTTFLRSIHRLEPLFQQPSWSGLVGQYTLLDLCIKETPASKILGKYKYMTYSEVTEDLRSLIFYYIKENFDQAVDTGDLTFRASLFERLRKIRDKYNRQTGLSLELETESAFEHIIFPWHFATELCYYNEDDQNLNCESKLSRKVSQTISRYLVYLLIFYPFMLPIGISYVKMPEIEEQARRIFKDTGAEASRGFFKGLGLDPSGTNETIRRSACNALRRTGNFETFRPYIVEGNKSSFLLLGGCGLSAQLIGISNPNTQWNFLRDIWIELLAYAATHSKGSNHAQQLRRGGELLSHVWLLFTHFGMTEQVETFQERVSTHWSVSYQDPSSYMPLSSKSRSRMLKTMGTE